MDKLIELLIITGATLLVFLTGWIAGFARGTWAKRKFLRQQEFEERQKFHQELVIAVRGIGWPPKGPTGA